MASRPSGWPHLECPPDSASANAVGVATAAGVPVLNRPPDSARVARSPAAHHESKCHRGKNSRDYESTLPRQCVETRPRSGAVVDSAHAHPGRARMPIRCPRSARVASYFPRPWPGPRRCVCKPVACPAYVQSQAYHTAVPPPCHRRRRTRSRSHPRETRLRDGPACAAGSTRARCCHANANSVTHLQRTHSDPLRPAKESRDTWLTRQRPKGAFTGGRTQGSVQHSFVSNGARQRS